MLDLSIDEVKANGITIDDIRRAAALEIYLVRTRLLDLFVRTDTKQFL